MNSNKKHTQGDLKRLVEDLLAHKYKPKAEGWAKFFTEQCKFQQAATEF